MLKINSIYLFLMLFTACSFTEQDNSIFYTRADSITFQLDTSLFSFPDTQFLFPATGQEFRFRRLFITNMAKGTIYFENPFNLKRKLIKAVPASFSNRKYHVWNDPYTFRWGEDPLSYCLPAGSSDTFFVADPFFEGDSILFRVGVYYGRTKSDLHFADQYLYQSQDNKIFKFMIKRPVNQSIR